MRNSFRYGWTAGGPLAAVALSLGLAWTLCAVPAGAQIVINEFLASPARDWNGDGTLSSRDDEWVEIYNPTSLPVVLDGYRVADADTSWRYGFTGTLAPHERLVVYGSESYAWEKATKHGPCVAFCPRSAPHTTTTLSPKGLPHRFGTHIGAADQEESPQFGPLSGPAWGTAGTA